MRKGHKSGLGYVAAIVCALMLGAVVTTMAQGLKASGIVNLGLAGKETSGGAVSSKSASTPGLDQIDERTKGMQAAITKAYEQFRLANGSADDKLARLDAVLAAIDGGLSQISENGPLYQEIGKAVQASEALQKKYKDKATDPNIEAKLREKYETLASKVGLSANKLIDHRIILNKQRTELEQRKVGLSQQKDFVVDLIMADDIAAANDALKDVVDSVKGLVDSIDAFTENISASSVAAPAGKEQR